MSDYTAVAPPKSSHSGGFDPSSAFADAVQRARQDYSGSDAEIAAKIHTTGNENNSSGGTKRPLEEPRDRKVDGTPEAKKATLNDPFGAQLAAMQQQQRAGAPNPNALLVEEWDVPDKMVGLIIGRGGEQITRLQAESGCKIQMATDSGGMAERQCTLTGSKQAIEKAKELLMQIINRGDRGPPLHAFDPNHIPDGHTVMEMMIPGPKVGLVIGKGGETIRNLQERAGVKMVMIQEGPQQTLHEKALRLTGEPEKCEYAKQLVMDLITEKELESLQRGNFMDSQTNEYGTSPGGANEILVPRPAVGVIIGKGGEMIKRIQQDSGAQVQFQQVKEDIPGDKMCIISGTQEQIEAASNIVHELINSVMTRDMSMGRGRGRGRGFDSHSEFGPGGGRGRGRGGGGGGGEDLPEVQFTVPANKCGLVIGKGGETIKGINQQSGAHVELARGTPPNAHEKVFVIKGNPEQIEHAQQLIGERIGMPPGQNGQASNPFPTQYPQPYQQQPQANQAFAPQGWGNAYQHWQSQPAAPNDPTKAVADANAAAWAAYYAQYYGQQAPQMQPAPQPAPQPPAQNAQRPPQQDQQPPQSQSQTVATSTAPAPSPAAPQPVASGPAAAGAQPDYSAAWIEYYRSLGMHGEADMIEQQARANQQQQVQTAQQVGQPYPQPSPVPTLGQPGPPTAQQPQGQPQQPAAPQAAAQPAPAVSAAAQVQPYQAPGPQGQWIPSYPQQAPYGQPQAAPYVGYNYAAYTAQQYTGTAQ